LAGEQSDEGGRIGSNDTTRGVAMIGRHGAVLRRLLRRPTLLAAAFAMIAAPIFAHAFASDPSAVLGTWLSEKGKVAVEIYPCEDNLCGKIVWLAKPYRRDGKVKRDDRNPMPALRDRPYCGIEVIRGLKPAKNGAWENGRAYDPKKGEAFDIDIELNNEGQLELRAYLGIRLLGKSETWTRPEPGQSFECVPEDSIRS
jgi:uncharacterized protein (DUF2147 family)